jgi:hypothetical protein
LATALRRFAATLDASSKPATALVQRPVFVASDEDIGQTLHLIPRSGASGRASQNRFTEQLVERELVAFNFDERRRTLLGAYIGWSGIVVLSVGYWCRLI